LGQMCPYFARAFPSCDIFLFPLPNSPAPLQRSHRRILPDPYFLWKGADFFFPPCLSSVFLFPPLGPSPSFRIMLFPSALLDAFRSPSQQSSSLARPYVNGLTISCLSTAGSFIFSNHWSFPLRPLQRLLNAPHSNFPPKRGASLQESGRFPNVANVKPSPSSRPIFPMRPHIFFL